MQASVARADATEMACKLLSPMSQCLGFPGAPLCHQGRTSMVEAVTRTHRSVSRPVPCRPCGNCQKGSHWKPTALLNPGVTNPGEGQNGL